MNLENLPQYELVQHEWIEDIRSDGYLLRHKKSGARILVLANDDENKVFDIGFKTLPTDSTGVAHIMEHSVLCGSRRFPVKDPFVELVKGSLNTFLNAMTYPDKTVFPIASCNDKDFCNLMDVYLDAVFYPNIYKHEEIFRQEGWSYQLEDPADEITINGVVYNEMKGAFSSPEDLLERCIMDSLFPDTVYGVESGGDPVNIPDLSYEEFLAFHKKYYHPANSYIYFYGNMDVEERLTWLDREYLSAFDLPKEPFGEVQLQKPFDQMHRFERPYPISESDPLGDNTYLAWSAVIGTAEDVELGNAFAVLEYALLSAPGAKLKQALLDAGIGNDIIGDYGGGLLQPYLSIVAKNTNASEADRFLSVIRSTLEEIVGEGIDKKALYAGINSMEFRFREADYGSCPKGLMYGLDVFDSWLYDDNAAFDYLKQLPVYAHLRELVETSYFEDLIRTYLLDNTHTSLVILTPERGLTAKTDAALRKKLGDYKASLSEDQILDLVKATKHLREYQETPDAQEDLEKIPMLARSDIGTESAPLENTEYTWDGLAVLHHDVFTNGIAYVDLLFDASAVAQEDIGYLGILKAVLGMVDTEHFSYADLNNDINSNTGGITAGISVYQDPDDQVRAFAGIRSSALYEKLPYAMEMSQEILTSRIEDDKRLYEIVAQIESRLSIQLTEAGHMAAAVRGMAYLSPIDAFNDAISGIAFYELAEDLEKHFDERKEALKTKLKELTALLFQKENLFVSVTADGEGLRALREPLMRFYHQLPSAGKKMEKAGWQLPIGKKNEGFLTAGQVQYVARTGNFLKKGYSYTGVMSVLKVLMDYEYLWSNLRVKGGAYGCMCSFYRRGDVYFVSYRDPHLRETNEVFEGIPDWLEHFDADEREMTKYIIGAISEVDTPLTPSGKGSRALNAYFSGTTEEEIQRKRREILTATPQGIRALAPVVRAVLDDGAICVVGNEDKLQQEADLFGVLRRLSSDDD